MTTPKIPQSQPTLLRLAALLLAALLAQGALHAAALGQLPDDDPDRLPSLDELGPEIGLGEGAGGLLLATAKAGRYVEAPRLETDVVLEVTGLVARGRVAQRFENPTAGWVEGVYAFPLPEDAAVDTLRLVIGERVIEGRIQRRLEARKTYTEAKAAGKKASLVEQERPNLFTTSVANIGPGEEVEVVLEYQQTLRYDAGRFRLRFPMTVGPRYVPGVPVANLARLDSAHLESAHLEMPAGLGFARPTTAVPDADRVTPPAWHPAAGQQNPLSLRVELAPGFELASLESPYHAVSTAEPEPGRHRVELAQGAVNADRDFELEWTPRRGEAPTAALFTESFEGDTYALLMVLPPGGEGAAAARLPREMVLVIDTSGSMHGASLEQARSALHAALDSLEPEDTFNVIQFNSRTESLFAASRPAAPAALLDAREYVDSLRADGGTEMLAALKAALSGSADPGRLRQVVFITDGSVANEEQLFGAIERGLGTSRLFSVGIGSAPNAYFMSRAARFGRGTFTTIGSPAEVHEKMAELFTKIESPFLTDLRLDWEDSTAEAWPREIPDLYAGEPVVVAARLPGAAGALGGQVRLSGRRGGRDWEVWLDLGRAAEAEATEVAEAGHEGGNGRGIDKLWARRKIAELMEGRAGQSDGEEQAPLEERVAEVALKHHLVSRYTSLVAVEVTPSRPLASPLPRRAVPGALPAGWNPAHVPTVGHLPRGGTPSRLLVLLGLGLVLAAALARWLPAGGR